VRGPLQSDGLGNDAGNDAASQSITTFVHVPVEGPTPACKTIILIRTQLKVQYLNSQYECN